MSSRDPLVRRALAQMRMNTKREVLRHAMSQPNIRPVRDTSAGLPEVVTDELVIGSQTRCDISSAIVATNVVRASTPPAE